MRSQPRGRVQPWKMFPADVDHIDGAREFIRKSVDSLGEWTRAQKNTLFAFSVAVVLWVAPSVISIVHGPDSDVMKFYDSHFPKAIAAMIGGLLLFFLPADRKKGEMTMSWKDGVEGIEWGTLLLFGGGLAMGSMMSSIGLAGWVGNGIKWHKRCAGRQSVRGSCRWCVLHFSSGSVGTHFAYCFYKSVGTYSHRNCNVYGLQSNPSCYRYCSVVVARIYDACIYSSKCYRLFLRLYAYHEDD